MKGSELMLVLLLALTPISAIQIGCSYVGSTGFYDLKWFAKKEGEYNEVPSYFFNICEKLHNKCDAPGKNIYVADTGCVQKLPFNTGTINDDSGQAVLTSTDGTFTMTLTFVCDQDADLDGKPEVKGSVVNNHLQATVKAKRSCASFSLTYIYQKYAYIFSIVFIAAGVFVTFFGLRLFKPVLFILTTLLITAVLLLLVYQLIMSSHTKQYLFWVVLGVSGLIGLTGAYFVTRYNGVCFVVAGGCLGGVLGFFIYGLAMASWAPPAALYGVIAGGAIICAILNWFFKDPIIILATGCTGAYLTVSGIGFFAGGFPSLTEIYNLFKDENVSIPYTLYLYLGGIALLAVVGVIIQCKFKPEKEDGDKPSTGGYVRYKP